MKKLIILTVILSLVLLCGCNPAGKDATTTNPSVTDPASEPSGSEPTGGANQETNPIDWETPIDIDDSFLDQPEETDPSESQATEPDATDPTESTPSDSEPSVPEEGGNEGGAEGGSNSEQPQPPSGNSSKPIELPMISG